MSTAPHHHSPAPWRWEFNSTLGRWLLLDANDAPIHIAGPPSPSQTPDMVLIAASPDLFASCVALLSHLDRINPPTGAFWSGKPDCDAARIAIGLAETQR